MEWVLVSNIRNHIYHRIGSNTFPSACFYTLFCYCFKLIGKTLQIVCLTQALITNNINSLVETVLILSPVSTIQNWANEFKKWLAFCEKPNKIRVRTLLRWVFAKSTKRSIELMERKAQGLNEILTRCIHRRDQTIMMAYLPRKYDYVLYVQMNEEQIQSYKVSNNNWIVHDIFFQKLDYEIDMILLEMHWRSIFWAKKTIGRTRLQCSPMFDHDEK